MDPDERGRAHGAPRAVEPAGHAVPRRRSGADALGRALALRVLGAHRPTSTTTRSIASRCGASGGRIASDPGARYWRDWMDANAAFRRYVLRELRRRGPLRTRDLEDRAVEGWQTGGWNDDGQDDGDDARAPVGPRRGDDRRPGRAAAALGSGRAMRARRSTAVVADRDRAPGRRGPAARTRRGHAEADRLDVRRPARRVGSRARRRSARGAWRSRRASATCTGRGTSTPDLLDRPFRPRTTLLSPFDDLVRIATTPSSCSASGSGWRSTCRRPSGSSATSCCRSCTATG